MKKKLLSIQNLQASIEKKRILHNLNLDIFENEIHLIMGPNGSGKSTFSKVLAGHPSYEVEEGEVFFHGKSLLEMSPEIRSHEGLFLAFQYPLEIAGVSNFDFLRIAYNEKQKYKNLPELDPLEFMQFIQLFLKKVKMRDEFLTRNLNEGFSGGEKKRNEILQMLLLDPQLIILDEIDSGLDIDAMKVICDGILQNRSPGSSLLIITHYPKMVTYFQPDFVHIFKKGKIVQTGDHKLLEQLETLGFDSFPEE
jgi:Fe-S cluster assembly ATP-binding protein